jgi:hypothetical protein
LGRQQCYLAGRESRTDFSLASLFGGVWKVQSRSKRIRSHLQNLWNEQAARTPPLGPAKILNRMIYPQDIAEKELSCRSSVLKDRVKT